MQPGDKLLPQLTVHARDWFEGQPIGQTAKALWDQGYAFDYVSDAQLKTAKVVGRKNPDARRQITKSSSCRNANSFRWKLSNNCSRSPKEGATVIFEQQLPADVSGLRVIWKSSGWNSKTGWPIIFWPARLESSIGGSLKNMGQAANFI